MVGQILAFLALDDFYGESEAIDRAKGKYKIPLSLKEGRRNYKRWQKR